MKVRFFDFSRYHGKNPPAGSTNIRVHQLIKYWPEAGVYLYGEHPEVLIFQKVYCTPDYKFPEHYPGIKILDICDPDWLDGTTAIRETIDNMDAVVCSSDGLQKFLRQLTDKPVIVIKDRFDLEPIPAPREPKGDAKTIVWFGYRHNAECLRYAMRTISELGLNLIVVSDDDPFAWQWLPREDAIAFKEKYTYVKYNESTIYDHLKSGDICLLPSAERAIDKFKSDNKTAKAILAGLPVAHDGDQLRKFIDEKERKLFLDENYETYRKEYDVRNSVFEYQELIEQIKK